MNGKWVSELDKRDPAAANRLRQHINEKNPKLLEAKQHADNARGNRSEIEKANNADHPRASRQAENRASAKDRRQERIAQRAERRKESMPSQTEKRRGGATSPSSPKRSWKRRPRVE